jgi:hypothetical protein
MFVGTLVWRYSVKDEIGHPYFSRFAVVTAGEAAWAMDGKFHLYAYDGTRFWRRRAHSTRYAIIPAWRTPSFGWMHADGCGCHLCGTDGQETAKAA